MQPQLTRNILDTLVYYDILDYPLTSFEIRKYLIGIAASGEPRLWRENRELRIEKGNNKNVECSLGDVIEALESGELKKHVDEFQGFYFLKGRKELVEKRIKNNKNSIEKYKIARKAAKWLRFAPFARMVAVTGTLAMKNCEKDSDIDFFVVLEKGRIFTGRLLVTAMVHLLGKRRHGKKVKNRICLNYFVTTGSLEIKRQDLFAANEYSFIYALFGRSVFRKFCEINLDWIKKFKPNWEIPAVEVSPRQRSAQKLFENLINFLFGDRMEAWLKKRQIARIGNNPLTKKAGAYVEATDENLIFLPEPQGPIIEKLFNERRILTKNI